MIQKDGLITVYKPHLDLDDTIQWIKFSVVVVFLHERETENCFYVSMIDLDYCSPIFKKNICQHMFKEFWKQSSNGALEFSDRSFTGPLEKGKK